MNDETALERERPRDRRKYDRIKRDRTEQPRSLGSADSRTWAWKVNHAQSDARDIYSERGNAYTRVLYATDLIARLYRVPRLVRYCTVRDTLSPQ